MTYEIDEFHHSIFFRIYFVNKYIKYFMVNDNNSVFVYFKTTCNIIKSKKESKEIEIKIYVIYYII